MNVLLTHGYFLKEDIKEQKIMRPYPPLGLLYVSAYLEKYGIKNQVYDTTFSSRQSLENHLLKEKPEYLGIYINLMTKLNVLELIRFVKNKLSHTTIILGGPDVRYNAGNLLLAGADYLVIGEGEETMRELVEALNNGSNRKSIQGIAFKGQNGQAIFTRERNRIKDMDELPLPNRKMIDLTQYQRTWRKFHGQSALSISTMRGCPYTCKWCSRAVYGLSYRRRSPELVVKEMALLIKEYKPDTLWFVDDVFTISHRWLAKFQCSLKEKGIFIPYECITRADRLNEEVIKTLKASGCFRIWIGAESGSQKVIDLMDRRVKVEQVRAMIKLTRRYGIEAGTFIMLGYPGETEDDIEKTIYHLKDANPDHFTMTVAYPIKGTELYEEVESLQLSAPAWQNSTDRDIDFQRNYSRRYYDFAVLRVSNEVNYHKSYHKHGLNINTARFKLKSMAAKAGMQYEKIFGRNGG